MTRPIVAVIGPGEGASASALEDATGVARGLSARGWIILTGGRSAGVMGAAARAGAESGGMVVGLLPGSTREAAAPELSVALATGLGEARNAVIATAADAVIVCGMNPGTASEAALAIRADRPSVFVRAAEDTAAFFRALASSRSGDSAARAAVEFAADVDAALRWLDSRIKHSPATG